MASRAKNQARKSTGMRSVASTASNQSSSNVVAPQTASPRKARKSTGARRTVTVLHSDDDEDFTVSSSSQSKPSTSGFSQPGSSRASSSSKNELSTSTLDALVNRFVSFILVADQKKYAIKKQDIIKHVFLHQESKLYGPVMVKALNILKKTFGLELLSINNRKNEYILINILDRELGTQEFAEYTPLELQKQGLVFYLLTLIFMNENVIGEDELWKALEPLGIDVNSRVPHPIFGDVKKYITGELVKQMYLEYKCISKDPPQYEFVWGERAVQEVGKEDLLEFACKVMGDCKPEDWKYQYRDAKAKTADAEGD